MRYLLQAYQRPNSPLRSLVKTAQFQQFLCNSAIAACDAPQNDLFDSLNVLATLTAAMQLLDDPAGCQAKQGEMVLRYFRSLGFKGGRDGI